MKRSPIRTFLAVGLVTLLVWSLAEGRTLRTLTLTVPVRIEAGSEQQLVRLDPEDRWDGVAELELQGPAALLDELRDDLADGVGLVVGGEVRFQPGGVSSVDLADAIRKSDLFLGRGVTIVDASPEVVSLEMAEAAEVTLPLVLDATSLRIRGTPEVTPASVTVRLPAGLAGRLPEQALTKPAAAVLAEVRPGFEEELTNTPVSIEGGPWWGMTIEPPRATVRLRLRSANETLPVPLVPVRVLLPFEATGRLVVTPVESDRALRDVTLTGPYLAIDRLRSSGFVPTAVVELSMAELERAADRGGVLEREARLVDLGPEVSAEIGDAVVRLEVRRVTEAVPTAPEQPADDGGSTAEPAETDPASGEESLDGAAERPEAAAV